MIGEGIKRNLLPKDVSLLQIEQNVNIIAALYKKQDKYIKVKWEIVKPINRGLLQQSLDTNLLFQEEEQGNIVFQSAEYIVHLIDSFPKIKSEEYYENEYEVNCDITITDDFLKEQTMIGTNIIRFENYLIEREKNKKLP